MPPLLHHSGHLAGGLAVAVLAAACAAPGQPVATSPTSPPGTPVEVSVSGCGSGLHDSAAGPQRLLVHDTDSRPGEARLVGMGGGAPRGDVYADLEPLGPGTTTTLRISLGQGRYAVQCLMEDEPVVTGPSVTVSGQARSAAPGVRPVSQADLIPASKAYERYVRRHIPELTREVGVLRRDVATGDSAAARRAWLTAHLAYERLGAAYDAFGPLDGRINGLPAGLPHGLRDRHWTGFHRVEQGVWHHQGTAALLREADVLDADVRRLGHQLASSSIDPLTVSIRAHEITENALQLELTGEDDFGSHSELATVSANLSGTRVVLGVLRPLLRTRLAGLGRLERSVTRARALVRSHRHGGRWTPLGDLSRSDREHLDAAVSELCERLAPVASVLEPRRTT